jgi:hypothetical protein
VREAECERERELERVSLRLFLAVRCAALRCPRCSAASLLALLGANLSLPPSCNSPRPPLSFHHTSTDPSQRSWHPPWDHLGPPGYRRACGIPSNPWRCRCLGQWLCDKASFQHPGVQGPGGCRSAPAGVTNLRPPWLDRWQANAAFQLARSGKGELKSSQFSRPRSLRSSVTVSGGYQQ